MSEILIEGLALPKKGEKVTIELFSDGLWCDYNNNNYHGKAIEVQTHGRLGDLDKLYEVATAPYGNFYGFEALIKDIKNAPTVLEASRENS